jgi:D-arabinose 1-dehydrogenase-like Zn-dependent alcohol dehydrogenase
MSDARATAERLIDAVNTHDVARLREIHDPEARTRPRDRVHWVPAAVEDSLRMCRRGGSHLVVGQCTDAGPAAINPHAIVYRRLAVRGSWAFTGANLERYVRSLPTLVKRHAIGELVTSFALGDASEARAAVGAGTVVKAVLSQDL